MIITKTPFRISFIGGGSDLPAYYTKGKVGSVISTSIDRYMYIILKNHISSAHRLVYSKIENADSTQNIEHPLVRESINYLEEILEKKLEYLELASFSDVPQTGVGLGSSSAYTVGLMHALTKKYQIKKVTPEQLAEIACYIEIEKVGDPIEKQDQYASALGGMNQFDFLPDGKVLVKPITGISRQLKELENSLLFFYTGKTRSASKILQVQSSAMQDEKKLKLTEKMAQLVPDFSAAMSASDLNAMGKILDENWSLKKDLTSNISDTDISSAYDTAIAAGAIGGKLLGAGGGGYLMFLAPKSQHKKISNALNKLKRESFKFESQGSVCHVL